jgi:AcrR family transcriptional regulator
VATGKDHRPIWALAAPADRKPRYSREQIADVALRIADADGFEAVTMKRIAAELGAATMTLYYYYVRNKSDIVALMQDAILAGVLVPDACLAGGWREALTGTCCTRAGGLAGRARRAHEHRGRVKARR